METATTIFIVIATIVAESLLERLAHDIRRFWSSYQTELEKARAELEGIKE